MKALLLIALLLYGLPLFAQNHVPSVSSIFCETNGLQVSAKTEFVQNTSGGQRRTENYVSRILSQTVTLDNQLAKVSDTMLWFSRSRRDTIDQFIHDTLLSIGFTANYAKNTFPVFIWRQRIFTRHKLYGYINDSTVTKIELKDVPYSHEHDSVLFSLDSVALIGAKASLDIKEYNLSTYTHTLESKLFAVKPGAFLRGVLVGLNTYLSKFNPQQYSIPLPADTIKKLYEGATTVKYYNDSPDTVKILSVSHSDQVATYQYDDGSSLNAPRTILPFTKEAPMKIMVRSKEGPYTHSRNVRFIVTKQVGKATLRDTFFILLKFEAADYSNRVEASTNGLFFFGKPGDTIDRTVFIFYSEPVTQVHPDGFGGNSKFQLLSTGESQGRMALHFRFIASQAGEAQDIFKFGYSYSHFDGSIVRSPESRNISLYAIITDPGAVGVEYEPQTFRFDSRSREITISLQEGVQASIAIYDLTGRVMQKEHHQGGGITITLRNNLPSGAYFVHIITNTKAYTYKILLP